MIIGCALYLHAMTSPIAASHIGHFTDWLAFGESIFLVGFKEIGTPFCVRLEPEGRSIGTALLSDKQFPDSLVRGDDGYVQYVSQSWVRLPRGFFWQESHSDDQIIRGKYYMRWERALGSNHSPWVTYWVSGMDAKFVGAGVLDSIHDFDVTTDGRFLVVGGRGVGMVFHENASDGFSRIKELTTGAGLTFFVRWLEEGKTVVTVDGPRHLILSIVDVAREESKEIAVPGRLLGQVVRWNGQVAAPFLSDDQELCLMVVRKGSTEILNFGKDITTVQGPVELFRVDDDLGVN